MSRDLSRSINDNTLIPDANLLPLIGEVVVSLEVVRADGVTGVAVEVLGAAGRGANGGVTAQLSYLRLHKVY